MLPSRQLALSLTVAALVVVLVVVAALAFGGLGPRAGTLVRSTPSVVSAVRDLARLESVDYHVERVIDLSDQQSLLFGLIHAQDAILLVAVGEVIAGVDLSELKDGDVTADPARGTVRIVLPPATVLVTRIDNEHTWVYARITDRLAQRHEDLEGRARQEAESTLTQSALDGGILDRARSNAERTVATLIRSLGYSDVAVTSRR